MSRTAERFLVRDVPLPTGLDAAALETLAQVVESSIVALISDERVGMTRAEMTVALAPAPVASEPEAAPVPPKPPPWRGALAAFYALEGFATDPAVEHGPGILAAADRRVGRWLAGGWVSAQYVIPMTVDGSLVGVRLDALALRAGPELAWDCSASRFRCDSAREARSCTSPLGPETRVRRRRCLPIDGRGPPSLKEPSRRQAIWAEGSRFGAPSFATSTSFSATTPSRSTVRSKTW